VLVRTRGVTAWSHSRHFAMALAPFNDWLSSGEMVDPSGSCKVTAPDK
jgi:hypothetical protein